MLPSLRAMHQQISIRFESAFCEEQGMLVIGGKHRGRRLSELVAEDPAYCHWILREAQEPQASCGMKDMAGWLMQNAPHLQETWTYRRHVFLASPRVPLGALTIRIRTFSSIAWVIIFFNLVCFNAWVFQWSLVGCFEERGIFAGGTRHRGRLLSELLSDDPAYCQWDSSADHLREQAAWLRENAPCRLSASEAYTRGFPCHKSLLRNLAIAAAGYWDGKRTDHDRACKSCVSTSRARMVGET
eukprot:s454_g13.t1